MKFVIGDPFEWEGVPFGRGMFFGPLEPVEPQIVRFQVITRGPVTLRCWPADRTDIPQPVPDGGGVVFCSGSGLIEAEVTLGERLWIWAESDIGLTPSTAGADILIRRFAASQEVAADDEPSFTTIEPRPSGPGEDMQRVLYAIQLNAAKREELLMEQIELLKQQTDLETTGVPPVNPPADPPADPPVDPVPPPTEGQ